MASENVTVSVVNMTTEAAITESIVSPIFLFVIGILGNISALVVLVLSSKEHKWRSFYRLVGGLLTTDLLGLFTLYPIVFVRYFSNFTYDFPPALCDFAGFMTSFTFMSSGSIVCVMSFDRFLAIMFPLKYNRLSNGFRINLTLIGIWIATSSICSLSLIGLGSVRSFYPGSWCFINFTSNNSKDRANTYIYAIVGIIILIATIALNTYVILAVCQKATSNKAGVQKAKPADVYIVVYLLLVVVIFTLCWTPLMIRLLINVNLDNQKDGPIDLLAVRLSVVNILLDPWIYLLLRKNNFLSLARLFRSLKRRIIIGQNATEAGIRNESINHTTDTEVTNETNNA